MSKTKEISIMWMVEDVLQMCPNLTEEQCGDVLDNVLDSHDAEHGVCWHTLLSTACDLFPEEMERENTI